jgi:MSHA biogenesis protein MshK
VNARRNIMKPAGRTFLVLLAGLGLGSQAVQAQSGLADPTRPATGGAPALAPVDEGAFALQSTLISPARRVAVINGRSYTVGDRVNGARILAIEPYAVQLDEADGRRTLRLLPRIKNKGTRAENVDVKP